MISISEPRQNSRIFLSFLVVGVGFGGFLLLKRRKKAERLYLPRASEVELASHSQETIPATEGLLHYKNKETRTVEWNDDGLPSKIVIEREYYQLP